MKETYAKPGLNRIGSFEEITQATATGPVYDATYPANTPHVPDVYDPNPNPQGTFS